MNFSLVNKTLLVILFILYLQNKREPTKRTLLKVVFNPKLLNNPLVSRSLINLDFLVMHTAYFDKIISFPLFAFAIVRFLIQTE